MAEKTLLHSPLHDKHLALEAKMGQESLWEVPLSYGNPLEEAAQTRRRAGVFDLSHFGRLRIRGDGALDLLERVCTADVAHQEDDTAIPSLLCNEQGGILDEGCLVRLEDHWLLVTSPGSRAKVLVHLNTQALELDVKIDDQTARTAMLAVTGPKAPALLDAVLPMKVSHLEQGQVATGSLLIAKYIALRASFSGQWGLQVILPSMFAGRAWDFITRKAGDNSVRPAGMAAMDVLRIEAGLPRYGHELNETIDPYTAGLEAQVDLSHDFVGAGALRQAARRAPLRKRVGLVLSPTGSEPEMGLVELVDEEFLERLRNTIPRQGSSVLDSDGADVGSITSGTYSPAASAVIAMAYVSPRVAIEGTALYVKTGSQKIKAQVTKLPFIQ